MRRDIRLTACGLLIGLVAVAACGSSTKAPAASGTATTASAVDPNAKESLPPGDIPDNQVFVAYSPAAGGYTLKYPEGWAQRQSGATSTFRQYFNSIQVSAVKSPNEPTAASARAQDVPRLRSLRGFKLTGIDSVSRSSGRAIRIVYDATSPKDEVTGKVVTLEVERYSFWHRGTLVTITLSSPKGSDNVDPWKTVTDSLVWK